MATRQRPGDLGADDAHRFLSDIVREVRGSRRLRGMSQAAAGRRAGMSAAQFGRVERNELRRATVEQVCRAARAVGLEPSLRTFASGEPIRDGGQLALLARFERLLGAPLRLRREVALPRAGDQRAWDGRVTDGTRTASIEGESRLGDAQAVARRVGLKQRDDPGTGVVLLVVARTTHNRRVLAEPREALRLQFPLDGAAIIRELRRGRIPVASGIVLV